MIVLTKEEVQTLKSMSLYWGEVRKREDYRPLTEEVVRVYEILGPSRILQMVEFYLSSNQVNDLIEH